MMRKLLIRLLCLLLALFAALPCALAEDALRGYDKQDGYVYLTLGTYPQTETGERLPILWRVLRVEDGLAYLCSEYVLDARRMEGDYKAYADKEGINGDFTKTELGLYLNGDFTANFTEGELSLVAEDETWGRFTLLTGDDLKDKSMGFGTNASRKAWGTEWAKVDASRGDDLFVYSSKYGRHSPYWLRDQSTSDRRHARCTKDEGEVGRINVITEDLGMRPACFLDMSRVAIASGSGTMEDPFVLLTGEAVAEPAQDGAADALVHYSCVLTVPAGTDPAAWSDLGSVTIIAGSGTEEDPYVLALKD